MAEGGDGGRCLVVVGALGMVPAEQGGPRLRCDALLG